MQIMQNAEHFVISTHVSARRRTKRANEIYSKYIYFNSRLRKETNVLVTRPNVSPTYFNSHPHKETNHTRVLQTNMGCHFNSRLRKETNNADDARRRTLCDFKSRFLAETNGFLLSGVLCQRISTHVSARRRTEKS